MSTVFANPVEALAFIKNQQRSPVANLRVKFYDDATCSYGLTSSQIYYSLIGENTRLTRDEDGPVNLIHGPIDWVLQNRNRLSTSDTLAYVMHETTRVPDDWINALNSCKAVAVPSLWNAACLNAQGLKVPVHVVELGHSDVYAPRDYNDDVVFGAIVSDPWRKNLYMLLQAFQDVPGNIRLKVRIPRHLVPVCDDRRVSFFTEPMDAQEFHTWKAACDFGIFPSAGEGFGLGQLEFAAIGRPVLFSHYGPPAEWLPYEPSLAIRGCLKPAAGKYADKGLWFWPDFEGLKSVIQNAKVIGSDQHYATYNALAQKFYTAAAPLTWRLTAKRLLAVLQSEGIYQ